MRTKNIRNIYLILLVVGFLFLVTGYSFSLDLLDYFLIGIICIYPIILFYQLKLGGWIKATITIAGLVLVFFIVKTLIFVAAFRENKKYVIQSWMEGKYEIELAQWQGWAGPSYKRCDVRRHALGGVLEQKIGQESYTADECVITVEGEGWNENKKYQIDICGKTIKRIK